MSMNIEVDLKGASDIERLFTSLQPRLKMLTAPALGEIAKKVAEQSKANVNRDHPRNLFRKPGSGRRITPNYRTKKTGDFWWVVQTPGTEAGAKEAIAEFAAVGYTPQGAALVRALSAVYGREGGSGGGRILYRTRDDMEQEMYDMFESAVSKAAAELDGGR